MDCPLTEKDILMRSKEYPYSFTIFIPTYNRAHLLPRALESIASQSYRDFEVIIIDDGSTDNTRKLVEEWIKKNVFSIRYFYQENRGKPSAHNKAVKKAKGHFFVTLDSDDVLAPQSLELLKEAWDNIPKNKKNYFAGVEGNCHLLHDPKRISGSYFPQQILDCTFIEMRYKYRVKGDKKGFILTSILKKYLFPIFPGEKHIRESTIWSRISGPFIFRYINTPIQYIEQFKTGLTGRHKIIKLKNPKGYSLSFLEILNNSSHYLKKSEIYSYNVRYIESSILANKTLLEQLNELNKNKKWWLIALPQGIIKGIIKKIKRKRIGAKE